MTTPRIAALLAGGKSKRMNTQKATITLDGIRLIDHVVHRLAGQVDQIVISGPSDFATDLHYVADHHKYNGPIAGIAAIHRWMNSLVNAPDGFLCVPVDGPFCPLNLYARLTSSDSTTYAVTKCQPHPTFAYWKHSDLNRALADHPHSLLALTRAAGAIPVSISPDHACFNVNTPDDLKLAQSLIHLNQLQCRRSD